MSEDFAHTPLFLGITRAGNRVHRVDRSEPLFASCGQYLSRRYVKPPIQVFGPLCQVCFTSEERHAVTLAEMEQS